MEVQACDMPADEGESCECEMDWNCGLHGGTSRPTFIESRFAGLDAEEAQGYR